MVFMDGGVVVEQGDPDRGPDRPAARAHPVVPGQGPLTRETLVRTPDGTARRTASRWARSVRSIRSAARTDAFPSDDPKGRASTSPLPDHRRISRSSVERASIRSSTVSPLDMSAALVSRRTSATSAAMPWWSSRRTR